MTDHDPAAAAPTSASGQPGVGVPVSELGLIPDTQVPTPHVHYVDTTDLEPDRVRALEIAEQLGVPLRGRLLRPSTAGRAPVYFYRAPGDPQIAGVRDSIATVLVGFRPYPAVAIDDGWNVVAANSGFALFTAEVAPELRTLPINLLRLSLHPDGLAGRILNLGQWRYHVLRLLAHAAQGRGRARLTELHAELSRYPGGQSPDPEAGAAVPLRIRSGHRELAFLSTVTALHGSGTNLELSVQAFLPADEPTADGRRCTPDISRL